MIDKLTSVRNQTNVDDGSWICPVCQGIECWMRPAGPAGPAALVCQRCHPEPVGAKVNYA